MNRIETFRERTEGFSASEKALVYGFLLIAVLVGSLLLAPPKPAHAETTFTVNRTGDENDLDFPGGTFDRSSDGKCDVSSTAGEQCTLRAAIQQANVTKGADTIAFNLKTPSFPDPQDPTCSATSKVCTISPVSSLPAITKPVTIDGYTQGDATANTIDDATENTLTQPGETNAVLKIGLDGNDTAPIGLFINASNVVIKGLAINNFRGQGIFFNGGTGHKVEGNFIGTNASGTLPRPNDNSGVIFSSTDGSTLGGTTPDKRNLISGNGSFGVFLQNTSSGNKIQGNLIGTDKNGSALGNSGGVGFSPSAGNGNRILSNSIFSNGNLGIDLSSTGVADGVTANDGDDRSTPKPDPDKDTGPNNLQNYPEITSATTRTFPAPASTSISATLESTPKKTFTIQFFSSPTADSPSGYGEGQTFLGQIEVKTDKQGKAPISFSTQAASEGEFITATATNKKTGDTSEFSRAQIVTELGLEAAG